MNLVNYGVGETYEEFAKYGDRLNEMDKKIDWESLRPIFKDLYTNDTVNGGGSNIDPIHAVNIQSWG
jgi:hypothetical protein